MILLWRFWECPLRKMIKVLYLLFLFLFIISCESCGPGKTGLKRKYPKKFRFLPLVFRQHEPEVSELSFKASGPPTGKILRKSRRFREELVRVRNPDILFRRDKKTILDRYMTPRCKEKLEILSIKVQNYWPGVRLQVTSGYYEHPENLSKIPREALHYEGRAVDIRTSDRDRSKYGMLARLALDAGFDWVHYESKAHVHCSCRSENNDDLLRHMKGCFHINSSKVMRKLPNSRKPPRLIPLRDLRIGDYVQATDPDGELMYSKVIAWLDSDLFSKTLLYEIKTDNGFSITLTPSHLLYTKDSTTGDLVSKYAGDFVVGDILYVVDHADFSISDLAERKIRSISQKLSYGILAPLTREGTIVVNGISSSCYAAVKDAELAHAAFTPLRIWTDAMGVPEGTGFDKEGVHPYAKLLQSLAGYILPKGYLFSDSI